LDQREFIGDFVLDQAIQLHEAGNLPGAEALYRRLLQQDGHDVRVLHLLAILCAQTGRQAEALGWIKRTLNLAPDFAAAWSTFGNLLSERAQWKEALAAHDRAIALGFVDVWSYINRGKALGSLNRHDAALRSYDAALALEPDHAEALSDRGVVLMALGRPADALDSYERALARQPIAATFSNHANALQELMRPAEALQSFERALVLAPDRAETHWNKALCLLRAGRLQDGLALYEWRKKRAVWNKPGHSASPEWTGAEKLEGHTLLIQAEQGLGDTIQFCRYAALAKARGAHVILSVQDTLVRLLQSLPVTVCGAASLPVADFHIPLMSMPLALGTTMATLPADTPYLFAEPERVAHWRGRIGSHGFRIGVCWQGAAGIETSRHFAAERLAPLARLPGVRLIGLQKGQRPAVPAIEYLGDDFDSGSDAFLDSAAAIQCLDLVITVDTALAHLAGALSAPTWVALKRLPDWRWFLDRDDTPWYPGMRLFRQPAPGDWDSVVSQIETALTRRHLSNP
jgi:tetratricopeptide (TPR) repeat protein